MALYVVFHGCVLCVYKVTTIKLFRQDIRELRIVRFATGTQHTEVIHRRIMSIGAGYLHLRKVVQKLVEREEIVHRYVALNSRTVVEGDNRKKHTSRSAQRARDRGPARMKGFGRPAT